MGSRPAADKLIHGEASQTTGQVTVRKQPQGQHEGGAGAPLEALAGFTKPLWALLED